MTLKKNIRNIVCIGALMGCIVMVIFPEQSIISAQKGIMLWANSIVPAMLPFFICVNFIGSMGVMRMLPPGLFTFVMSIMSGYPMGPKIISDMIKQGIISVSKAKWLLSFSTLAGPTFMTATAGVSMLGDFKYGIVIAISHYLGAFANYVIFRAILKPSEELPQDNHFQSITKKGTLDVLTDSIIASFRAVGIILAYIIIFMFVTDFMDYSAVLGSIDSPLIKSLIKGLLEMTVGCNNITASYCSSKIKTVFCTFFISFGGCSIIGQSMSMLAGTGIKLWYIMVIKLCHGAFSTIISYFMCKIM